MKKSKRKSLAMWLVIAILGVVALTGLAKASAPEFSWASVEDKLAQLLFGSVQPEEGLLGASGTRYPSGVSADSTSPSAGQVRGTTLTITGASTAGSLQSTGDLVGNLLRSGSVAAKTATTTLTAAEVCDSSLITLTAGTSTPTITFPATTTLFADCLDTTGDSKVLTLFNGSTVTTTIIAAGTGGTAYYSSTLTIGTSDTAVVELIRNDTVYLMLVTNQPS
mgnify:CR=1 FL=1